MKTQPTGTDQSATNVQPSGRWPRRRTLAAFVGGALCATALIGGGVAIASIPSSSTGQITACVNNSTRAVRIIDYQSGARCHSGESTISWSKGYRYRGAWSGSASYSVLDVVTDHGSTYLARAASTNRSPAGNASYWGMLAARGATGATGPAGPAGPAGPSNAYAGYRDGPIPLAGSGQLHVASLSIPSAGQYVMTAKVTLVNSGGLTQGSCKLVAGGDFDLVNATIGSSAQQSMALLVVHTFAAAGHVELTCNAMANGHASFAKIAAIKVGSLTNNSVS